MSKFQHTTAKLRWNKAHWLVKSCPVTWTIQSECFFLRSVVTIFYDIGSRNEQFWGVMEQIRAWLIANQKRPQKLSFNENFSWPAHWLLGHFLQLIFQHFSTRLAPKHLSQRLPGGNIGKKFQSIVTTQLWNKAFWLSVTIHVHFSE